MYSGNTAIINKFNNIFDKQFLYLFIVGNIPDPNLVFFICCISNIKNIKLINK